MTVLFCVLRATSAGAGSLGLARGHFSACAQPAARCVAGGRLWPLVVAFLGARGARRGTSLGVASGRFFQIGPPARFLKFKVAGNVSPVASGNRLRVVLDSGNAKCCNLQKKAGCTRAQQKQRKWIWSLFHNYTQHHQERGCSISRARTNTHDKQIN